VQEADTLSAIAREVYGDDRLWTKIRDANPGIDPDRLLVGQKLRLPPKEAVRAGRSAAPAVEAGRAADAGKRAEPGRPSAGREPGEAAGAAPKAGAQEAGTYVVESGDTLIRIARKVFNDPGRWREIYELNRDRLRSPDEVPVGMTLKLPQPRRDRPRERG
jgi:nucleoid-associated protein YgaU